MTWIPIGPTLVTAPRVWDYARLARANAYGAQCAVLGIAVHPGDERNIVVVTRRVGGSSAFRSLDDGHSWQPIADDLTRANPQLDLACAAVHPALANVVYLGARAGQRVVTSVDGGVTWPQQRDPGGGVTRLIVDRASGPDWHTATLYAATTAGVATSVDGGDTWTMAALGEVTSLAVYMPASGARQFYAGVYGQGLYYATAPGGPWQNLFGSAAGLPPIPTPGSNLAVYVDYSPRQPDRVYALVTGLYGNHYGPTNQQLYVSTAAAPSGAWATRGPVGQPVLDYGLEGVDLMVAPEPIGPDTGDVLLCTAGVWPWRSVDGGRNWDGSSLTWGSYPHPGLLHHVDMRSLAHHPAKTAYYPDVLPTAAPAPRARVYLGSDGGLGASRGYTDPLFSLDSPPGPAIAFNSGATYDPSVRMVESLNHGLASIAAHQYASNPDPLAGGPLSDMAYVTALDTGGARRIGTLSWQPAAGGDGGPIFIAPQPTGVRVWTNESVNSIYPLWNLMTWLDQDPPASSVEHVTTAAAPSCGATSNMVSDSSGGFYAGVIAREQVSTLGTALTIATTGQVSADVYPVTMTPELVVGARVGLGAGDDTTYYPISAVYPDHFTVLLFGPATHPVGTPVRVQSSYAAHVSAAVASRISQVFVPQNRRLYRLARSGDTLLAASADQRLWTVASASVATPFSVWTEVTGRPADLSGSALDEPSAASAGEYVSGLELQRPVPLICCVAADAIGTFYVMLSSPVTATIGTGTVSTVLFRVTAGAWDPQSCPPPASATIAPGVTLGRMVAHPTVAGRLYVSRNARLFQLDPGLSGWTWTDLTDNLPGQEIHDLWIGNIAATGAPARFVLRATTAVRGVWELELGLTQAISGARPYFRDHAFDPGWTGASIDGVASPLNPTHHHYHWQSADIKVDTPLRDSAGALYYQNDPEAPTPTPGDFAWIKDRSQAAAAGTTARIWVRVNNRSTAGSGPLSVWALTCPFSGALPALPAGFWSRFHADGTLDSSAPGGVWTSLGVQPLSGIHAEAPGIVGFTVPTGSEGDHRCIVVVVHGPDAALDTSGLSLSVDEVVPARPQIAQRNVIVGPPLPASPGTPPPAAATDWPGGFDALSVRHYIEFHNPSSQRRATTIRFDLRDLPPGLSIRLRLSTKARPETVTGAKVRPGWLGLLVWLSELLRGRLRGRRRGVPKRLRLALRSYRAKGCGVVELHDIALPPGGKAAALFWLKRSGALRPGYEHHLDMLQFAKERLVGGATLVLPVAGDPRADSGYPQVDWVKEREAAGQAESRSG